jgi:uncharacterized membrane protein
MVELFHLYVMGFTKNTSTMKLILLWTFAILMMVAGINHIIQPHFYKTFIPRWMPLLTVNYIVGFIEFAIGITLLFPALRPVSALALLILMIAFLPFHLMDVFKERPAIGSRALAYIRLPVQFLLIWWAWYLFRL